eukprot:12917599-Prorocentrum_lima.AAC.1
MSDFSKQPSPESWATTSSQSIRAGTWCTRTGVLGPDKQACSSPDRAGNTGGRPTKTAGSAATKSGPARGSHFAATLR